MMTAEFSVAMASSNEPKCIFVVTGLIVEQECGLSDISSDHFCIFWFEDRRVSKVGNCMMYFSHVNLLEF